MKALELVRSRIEAAIDAENRDEVEAAHRRDYFKANRHKYEAEAYKRLLERVFGDKEEEKADGI